MDKTEQENINQYLLSLERTLELLKTIPFYDSDPWSCDACGGDNTTGCLWHDPTECPKFT